jgi:PAS domain S-box-containing protein
MTRQRAEDEIQSLTRFPSENPNPVLRISQEGTIFYANRASQPWLETSQVQVGSPAPPAWQEIISHTLKTGLVEEFEVDIGPKTFAFTGRPFPESGYVNFYGHDITERKRAEAALRESEQRYRSLFQNNHSVMLLIDPETGHIIDANPAACAFYGYPHAEMTQLKITDINQLTREQIFAEMERAKREQRRQFYFRHRVAGGEVCDVEVFSGPIEWRGKKLLYSIIHDITERRQAEEALRLSEERFAKAFRMSPDVLVISRQTDGQLLEVNDRWEDLFGYSPSAVIGRTSLELNLFVNPKDRSQFIHQLQQIGSVRNYELEIRRKSGEIRQATLSVEAIIIDNEPCLLTIIRDITERKQAEAALRESEEKFKALFNLLPIGVSILNEELKILVANPALGRILDLSQEEFFGEGYKKRTYLRSDETPMLPEELPSVRALKEQGMVENVEIGVLPASGNIIWTNVSATPLPFLDWRLVVITSDITERKQAAVELQRAMNCALHSTLFWVTPNFLNGIVR